VTGVAAGGKVKLSCKGKGCRFSARTVKAKKGTVVLTPLVKRLRLARGAQLTIRATAPHRLTVTTRIRITKHGAKLTRTCSVRSGETVACP
jgi:hypothetical protein